ncbi:hypothetical protein [Rugamonas apoptosis]|uniref:Uncharacterized protein n=1 Tax=Rugamonas apoptosis TaxID=2758570 RepID=A0A7W2FCB4_9BURK|nr:hypothetical protein [Rugamonas apoptosis]MBA5689141.1 hypothetical protein [Rugamonas apoptosis]
MSNAQDREPIGQDVAAGGAGMAGSAGSIAATAATSAAIPIVGWAVGGAIIAGVGAWGVYKLVTHQSRIMTQNFTGLAALASATARSMKPS